ncbi:MAG: hypothetical protein FJ395_20450 [Verrucomicrobia bacterium]|nr:hypothetical protein [Verrucomicrobiota bacterium]
MNKMMWLLIALTCHADYDFNGMLKPVPATAKFIDPDFYIWCGTMVKGDDGKHHVFYFFTGKGKSTALFESADGFDWKLSAHPLVATTEITRADGRKQKLNSLERPQLFFDNGKPVVLMFACDEDSKREHSFNVQIPLK